LAKTCFIVHRKINKLFFLFFYCLFYKGNMFHKVLCLYTIIPVCANQICWYLYLPTSPSLLPFCGYTCSHGQGKLWNLGHNFPHLKYYILFIRFLLFVNILFMMLIYQPKLATNVSPCFVSPANRSLVGILHNNRLRHRARCWRAVGAWCIFFGIDFYL
jgi:hypothetical protein